MLFMATDVVVIFMDPMFGLLALNFTFMAIPCMVVFKLRTSMRVVWSDVVYILKDDKDIMRMVASAKDGVYFYEYENKRQVPIHLPLVYIKY